MKKIFFLSYLFLLSSFVSAQAQSYDDYAMFIGEELTQKTNGYIDLENSNDEGSHVIRIVLPQDETFDNVRSEVNSFFAKYSDLNVVVAWRKHDELYHLFIKAGENEEYDFMISYTEDPDNKYLIVGWGL